MLAPLVPTIRLLGPSPKIILRLPRLDLTGDTYVNTDSKTRRASFRAHKLDTFDFSHPHFEFPRDDGIFSCILYYLLSVFCIVFSLVFIVFHGIPLLLETIWKVYLGMKLDGIVDNVGEKYCAIIRWILIRFVLNLIHLCDFRKCFLLVWLLQISTSCLATITCNKRDIFKCNTYIIHENSYW